MTDLDTTPRTLDHDGIRRASVELGSGLVDVVGSDDGSTHVTLEARHDDPAAHDLVSRSRFTVSGDQLVVDVPREGHGRSPEVALRIATPYPLELRVKVGSADLTAEIPIGESKLLTGSGDIRLTQVDGVLVAGTGSGNIRVDETSAPVRLNTGSGSIEVGNAAALIAGSTGSGDVRIGEAAGPVKVKVGSGDITIDRVRDESVATSGSGDVRVGSADGPSVLVETARGNVHVGVPDGTPTYLDLKTVTGDIRCELDPSDKPADDSRALALRARTVTGDITVVRV